MSLRIMYGAAPASATFNGSREWLTVSLDKDPGIGSMTFTRISPTVVHILLADQLRAVCGECRTPLRECRHALACCRSTIGPACGHVTV